MKVTSADGVKVYNVSSGTSVPEWISETNKKRLKKSEEYRRRLELIQDFEFPEAVHRLKATADGKHILASGIHPPRFRCFDLSQLSLKFEQHYDAEVVDFEILSDDYSKVAMICTDRTLLFQAKGTTFFKSRIPRFGRDLAYHPYTADLLVATSSNELFRLNLEEGRFQEPLQSEAPAINRLDISPVHGLVAAAGEEGRLECFDLRQEKRAGCLDAAAAMGAAGEDLTSVSFDGSGLHCAVGTGNGLVGLFDLRSSKPMLVKDHMYSSPIVNLKFHSGLGNQDALAKGIVSADKHIVRVWDASSGQGFTSIQPPAGGINDLLLWKDSGLLMVACEDAKIQAYFIPSLGPAPSWCSFLEGLTEELEETATPTVYDDYRFVTRDELGAVGLSHLVGSSLLRAYMHGFFVHNKLWQKARAVANPVDYETARKERIQSKLDAEKAQRITLKRKLPKVNAALAAKLASEADDVLDAGKKKKAKAEGQALLADERFKSIFSDPAFTIDEEAEEYKVLHPNADKKRDKRLVQEHFESLGSEDEASGDNSSGDSGDRSETPAPSEDDLYATHDPGSRSSGRKPRMMAAKSDEAARAFQQRHSLSAQQALPLAERSERTAINPGKQGIRVGGQRKVTFIPRGSRGFHRGGRASQRGRGRGRGRSDRQSSGRSRGGFYPGRPRGCGRRGGRGRGRGQ